MAQPSYGIRTRVRIVNYWLKGERKMRPMTAQEVKATAVLSLPISEASAKIGAGMPTDPPEDMGWPVWAGQVGIRQVLDLPEPDGVPKGHSPRIRRFQP